jgi:immunoglobulin-like protein involved in spore germination
VKAAVTLLLAGLLLVAAGCGSGREEGAPAPEKTTTPAAPGTMAVTVFRVRDGVLRAERAEVRRSAAVAAAALDALGLAPAVTIAGGTAKVDLARARNDTVAEIVYTLTQFPTVDRVDVAGRSGLTRDDFAAYVPPISVESPPSGARVPGTFHVSGTASVFEATLVVQLLRGGAVIAKRTVTASEGAPGRGAFDATFTATGGALTVSAFAPSAADGSPQHRVDVPVTVVP